MCAATDINVVLVERLITAHLSAVSRVIKAVRHLSVSCSRGKFTLALMNQQEASRVKIIHPRNG